MANMLPSATSVSSERVLLDAKLKYYQAMAEVIAKKIDAFPIDIVSMEVNPELAKLEERQLKVEQKIERTKRKICRLMEQMKGAAQPLPQGVSSKK